MYEIFLSKSVNSKITQNVNGKFILQYNDYSYDQLNSLWKEAGLGSYCDGLFKIINPADLKDVLNDCYIMDYDKSFLPFVVVLSSTFIKIFLAPYRSVPNLYSGITFFMVFLSFT